MDAFIFDADVCGENRHAGRDAIIVFDTDVLAIMVGAPVEAFATENSPSSRLTIKNNLNEKDGCHYGCA